MRALIVEVNQMLDVLFVAVIYASFTSRSARLAIVDLCALIMQDPMPTIVRQMKYENFKIRIPQTLQGHERKLPSWKPAV